MGAVIDFTEQTASRETSSIFSTTIRIIADFWGKEKLAAPLTEMLPLV